MTSVICAPPSHHSVELLNTFLFRWSGEFSGSLCCWHYTAYVQAGLQDSGMPQSTSLSFYTPIIIIISFIFIHPNFKLEITKKMPFVMPSMFLFIDMIVSYLK